MSRWKCSDPAAWCGVASFPSDYFITRVLPNQSRRLDQFHQGVGDAVEAVVHRKGAGVLAHGSQLARLGQQAGDGRDQLLAGHIGEELKRLPPLPAWSVVIVHPRVPVQTKQAYALFDSRIQTAPVAVDAVEQAVRAGDFQGLTAAMGNTFEELIIPNVPQVADCQQRLTALGLQPLMAGSGPTVFALVPPGQEETVRSQTASWHDVDVYMTAIVK